MSKGSAAKRPEGFKAARENKGHPKRRARQERAAERATGPTSPAFRIVREAAK